ncbi:MAG: aminotransferase class III-fold pyridoxal phosphate-dependent enzyme [Dehalococcoidia bacterium]
MTEPATAPGSSFLDRARKRLWVQNQPLGSVGTPGGPLVIDRGEGIYLWDTDGKKYIDALSGLWVTAVGHGRTELGDVAREQMSRLAYASTFDYATAPAVELAAKLIDLAPPSMARAYFVNSGSEAVEIAIKIAKQYHYNRGDKKRFKVISRIGSYHGQTAGALSVNAAGYTVKPPFEPLVPGSVHVPGINCYRCPYEKAYPECDVFCARTIEDRIKFEGPETVAAFIAEPISIANANYVPPAEYWQTLRRICDEHGVLLIADEVINGFGRTGKWFGIQHFDVVPDLMTCAKQISSGYIPLGAVLVRDRVAEAFEGPDNTFRSGLTFGAHPVSTAVGLANVSIIERERLVENAASVGAHLGDQLREVASRHAIVGDVRGIGLLWGVEIVRDRQTKQAFPADADVGGRLTEAFRKRGLLTRPGNITYIAPPLILNREEADAVAEIVDEALGELEAQLA